MRTGRTANVPPHTRTAGHTPRNPCQTAHRHDEPCGNDQRHERQLTPGHGAERVRGRSVTAASVRMGVPMGTECHRRRVRDERQPGRVEGCEAKPDEQRRADRHRRPKARRTLDECPERERHEQRLDAAIGGQTTDGCFHDLELAGFDGQVVQEYRVDDDPAGSRRAIPIRRGRHNQSRSTISTRRS